MVQQLDELEKLKQAIVKHVLNLGIVSQIQDPQWDKHSLGLKVPDMYSTRKQPDQGIFLNHQNYFAAAVFGCPTPALKDLSPLLKYTPVLHKFFDQEGHGLTFEYAWMI